MNREQLHELLYQSLATELGGIQVHQTALEGIINAALKKEWQEYLEQTETHAQILCDLFTTLTLPQDREPPGRQVVRHIGQSLVTVIEMVIQAEERQAAQLVAAKGAQRCQRAAGPEGHAEVTERQRG
jgi:hypothetical protein